MLFLGALITGLSAGAASLAGAGLSSGLSIREAKKNRKFQERMSSTAVQRRTADMRKAGINPILSVPGGASSPGGATGQIADFSKATTNALEGFKTGMAKKRLTQELGNMRTKQGLDNALILKANEEASLASTNAKEAAARTRILDAQAPMHEADAEFYSTPTGKVLRFLERAAPGIFGIGAGATAGAMYSNKFRKGRMKSHGTTTKKQNPNKKSRKGGKGDWPSRNKLQGRALQDALDHYDRNNKP